MQNGLAIIEMTDTETMSVYIDQDALECARLNAKVSKRLNEAKKAKQEVDRKHRKAEKAAAQRKAYNIKTFSHILISAAIVWAVTWAGIAGMIHPFIYIPVALFCLCAACVRLGAWFGRVAK